MSRILDEHFYGGATLIDPQARPGGYLKLLGLVVGMGLISAAIALPGAVRLGLDPRAAFTSRVSALTGGMCAYTQ